MSALDIEKIARNARQAWLRYAKSRAYGDGLDITPENCTKGWCSEMSTKLADDLIEAGVNPKSVTIVAGAFKGQEHTWVEVAGSIIDISADQFGAYPKVWMDAPKKNYREQYRYFHTG